MWRKRVRVASECNTEFGYSELAGLKAVLIPIESLYNSVIWYSLEPQTETSQTLRQ